jgi:hypothetical protein
VLLLVRRRAERSATIAASTDTTQPQPLEQQLDQLIEQYRRKS